MPVRNINTTHYNLLPSSASPGKIKGHCQKQTENPRVIYRLDRQYTTKPDRVWENERFDVCIGVAIGQMDNPAVWDDWCRTLEFTANGQRKNVIHAGLFLNPIEKGGAVDSNGRPYSEDCFKVGRVGSLNHAGYLIGQSEMSNQNDHFSRSADDGQHLVKVRFVVRDIKISVPGVYYFNFRAVSKPNGFQFVRAHLARDRWDVFSGSIKIIVLADWEDSDSDE